MHRELKRLECSGPGSSQDVARREKEDRVIVVRDGQIHRHRRRSLKVLHDTGVLLLPSGTIDTVHLDEVVQEGPELIREEADSGEDMVLYR